MEELSNINFAARTSVKATKHERASHYGNYIMVFKELEDVSRKASLYKFFDYGGKKLIEYSDNAKSNVESKVDKIKETFKQEVETKFAVPHSKDLLSQKVSREVNTHYQNIYSGYNNLLSIYDNLDIIDLKMKTDIKDQLDNLKVRIDERVQNMKEEAKKRCMKEPENGQFIDQEDLVEIGKILIEIQLMKTNFL